jgi:hypothetical protein
MTTGNLVTLDNLQHLIVGEPIALYIVMVTTARLHVAQDVSLATVDSVQPDLPDLPVWAVVRVHAWLTQKVLIFLQSNGELQTTSSSL